MNTWIKQVRSPIRALLLALMILPAEAVLMAPQTASAHTVVRRGAYGRTTVVRRGPYRTTVVRRVPPRVVYRTYPYRAYRPYYGARGVERRVARRVTRRHIYRHY